MVGPNYARNMRRTHGWAAAALAVLILAANPAFAAPKRVVSTFLCTDEYVFRLLPRERIAALSFEATDRHDLMRRVMSEEPERLRALVPHLPRDLETVIQKAIAREPVERYP